MKSVSSLYSIHAGIDIAKHRHEASLIDERGHLLDKSLSFANSKEGCEAFVALLDEHGASAGNVIVGMEATGH